jgi:aryl sulfotransferase
MASLVEAATFGSMKANADRFVPASGKGIWHRDDAFFDSASSNKWKGRLSEADLTAYDKTISRELSPDERAWLEWGSRLKQKV